jgi:RNA polymerase sigma factor (sigma-70 family)
MDQRRREQQALSLSSELWDDIQQYRAELIDFARFMLRRSREMAITPEDIAQQAMIRVCNRWSRSRPQNRVLRNTLLLEARGLTLNALRNDKLRQTREGQAGDQSTLLSSSDDETRLDRVLEILGELPERQRAVVSLYSEGLDHAAIAEIVGLPSPGACRAYFHRIIKRIRRDAGRKRDA